MKLLLLTLFVAAATAIPIPAQESGPVEVIVVGLPEGQALDLDHVLDVKVNEHVDGEIVSSSNALYPFSSEGIQAAIAAQQAEIEVEPSENLLPEVAEIDSPQPVALLPETITDVAPEPVVLPQAPTPEVVEPEQPEEIKPEIATPEITPEVPVAPAMPVGVVEETPEEAVQVVESAINAEEDNTIPETVPQGEVYNDGTVQVNVNAQTGLLATLQSWLDVVINTFNNQGVQVSNQII